MIISWYYGIIVNSLFFTLMWALSTKYLNTKQQFILQIIVLPIVYFINVWYGKSMQMANQKNIPMFVVTLVSISVSMILSLLFGKVILGEQIKIIQLVGGIIVVTGIILMKL